MKCIQLDIDFIKQIKWRKRYDPFKQMHGINYIELTAFYQMHSN